MEDKERKMVTDTLQMWQDWLLMYPISITAEKMCDQMLKHIGAMQKYLLENKQ